MLRKIVGTAVALLTVMSVVPAVAVAENRSQPEAVAEAITAERLTIAGAVANGSLAVEDVRAGWVRIRSLYGAQDQCLEAQAAGGGGNGTRVRVWTCDGTAEQDWFATDDFYLINGLFSKCLDADVVGGGGNGTRLQLWDCNASSQQRWFTFANDMAIYNDRFYNNGNTVVDRDVNVVGNGAPAQLWTKNFQPQQWWRPEAI